MRPQERAKRIYLKACGDANEVLQSERQPLSKALAKELKAFNRKTRPLYSALYQSRAKYTRSKNRAWRKYKKALKAMGEK